MTDSSFIEIARALDVWPELPPLSGVLPAPYQRLLDAVFLSATRAGAWASQTSSRWSARSSATRTRVQGAEQHLLVPAVPDGRRSSTGKMLTAPLCRRRRKAHRQRIRLQPAVEGGRPASVPLKRHSPAVDFRVPGDPFLADALGPAFTDYSSPGQRQAIRTVLTAQDSATVVVNLPTGTGKSAVAIAPALLRSATGGVSVMVVPTTSLALDQERAVQEHLAESEPGRDDPARFVTSGARRIPSVSRSALRSGRNPATIFGSPELLLTSLAPSLYAAAEAGHLRYFVVDEAHIVASWGVEFRPEFQALSGFRRDLLRVATTARQPGFKTILMRRQSQKTPSARSRHCSANRAQSSTSHRPTCAPNPITGTCLRIGRRTAAPRA